MVKRRAEPLTAPYGVHRAAMYFHEETKILTAVGVMIAVCLGLVLWICFVVIPEETAEWGAFKISHECKVTAKVDGEVFNTFSFDGKGNLSVGIAATKDKTGWSCNDGVTYYK